MHLLLCSNDTFTNREILVRTLGIFPNLENKNWITPPSIHNYIKFSIGQNEWMNTRAMHTQFELKIIKSYVGILFQDISQCLIIELRSWKTLSHTPHTTHIQFHSYMKWNEMKWEQSILNEQKKLFFLIPITVFQ